MHLYGLYGWDAGNALRMYRLSRSEAQVRGGAKGGAGARARYAPACLPIVLSLLGLHRLCDVRVARKPGL